MEFSDEQAIEEILMQSQQDEHRIADLVYTIVSHSVFRRSDPATSADVPTALNETIRVWTSGKFSVKARFLRSTNGVVTLELLDGRSVDINLERLSAADQEFVTGK